MAWQFTGVIIFVTDRYLCGKSDELAPVFHLTVPY